MLHFDYDSLISLLESFNCDFDVNIHLAYDSAFGHSWPIITIHGIPSDVVDDDA